MSYWFKACGLVFIAIGAALFLSGESAFTYGGRPESVSAYKAAAQTGLFWRPGLGVFVLGLVLLLMARFLKRNE